MKMPTTSASGTRSRAKAPARKTTLARAAKSRTASAKPKSSATRPGSKAKPRTKAAAKVKAKASTARGKTSGSQVSGAAKTTTSHAKIQQWAESRRGVPSTVKSTRSKNDAGLLRIDFPGYSGAGSLKKISWDEWFEKFDESRLAFLYQDKTKDGKQSRFFKLVKK